MIAVVFAAALTPLSGAPAGCPREAPRIVQEANFTATEAMHPTHPRVRFLVDVGSDGRVRRSALVESSGDATLDAAASEAIGRFRYAAPTMACVSASFVTAQYWDLPPDALASPVPVPSATPAPAPPAACEPFVRPSSMVLPPHREPAGTAIVDVALDASARVTGVQLATSSGNKKTDYAAAVAARRGTYVFVEQPGCTPRPTKYRLELTFR